MISFFKNIFHGKVKPKNVWADDIKMQEMVAVCYNENVRFVGVVSGVGMTVFGMRDSERDDKEDLWKKKSFQF